MSRNAPQLVNFKRQFWECSLIHQSAATIDCHGCFEHERSRFAKLWMVVVDPRFFHSNHGALQCAIDRYRQHSAPSWTDDEDVRWTAMDPWAPRNRWVRQRQGDAPCAKHIRSAFFCNVQFNYSQWFSMILLNYNGNIVSDFLWFCFFPAIEESSRTLNMVERKPMPHQHLSHGSAWTTCNHERSQVYLKFWMV